jgi:MFS family permease
MTMEPAENASKSAARGYYPLYVLTILVLVNALAYLDRQVMLILVEPIQTDLGINDTQMGIIIGPAFMALFLAAAMPMGALADRHARNRLLAAGVAIWSLATLWAGRSDSFGELVLARACVGLGEACVVPAVFSLVTDYFAAERRGRAMAVVTTGVPIGAGMALFGGGLILQWATEADMKLPAFGAEQPWEVVLVLFGLLGLVVALLTLSIAEPRREGTNGPQAAARPESKRAKPPADAGFLAYLRKNPRAIAVILVPYVLLGYIQIATFSWVPTLLMRLHGLGHADTGMIVGAVTVIVPIVTSLIAGTAADYLFRRTATGAFLIVAWIGPLILPGILLIALSPTVAGVAAGLILACAVGGAASTTAYVALQAITPAPFRGRKLALYNMLLQVTGLGAGPLIVAAITDYVFADRAMLNFAIIVAVVPAWVAAVYCGFAGRKSYARLRLLVSEQNGD